MTEPKKTAKEAKRLRKSVKRRRSYVESLRITEAEVRASAMVSGNEDDARFADRLRDLAESELATAREEEKTAKEIEGQNRSFSSLFGGHSSVEMQARAQRAIEAVKGRLASDRIQHLLDHHKIERSGDNDLDMMAVEKILGITEIVRPKGKPRLQMGARITLAETTLYGAPRF